MIPKTFCALPFSHLAIDTDGGARLCHRAATRVEVEGRPLSLHTDRFESIWNSEYMKQVRRDMVAGRPVVACSDCYLVEADGSPSLRQQSNAEHQRLCGLDSQDAMVAEAETAVHAHGAVIDRLPSSRGISLGNTCNLACRMCRPRFSSRIAADAVHATWRSDGPLVSRGLETMSRLPVVTNWGANEAVLFDEVMAEPRRLRVLEISGGEPLVHPQLPAILERLVREGHSRHIALHINTNGTVFERSLTDLLTQFEETFIYVSLDGVGPLQEYIRPPSRWEEVSRNVLAYAGAGISVTVSPTPQAYNVFGLMELVQYWEARGIPITLDNMIREGHLGLDLLPKAVVDEAAAEWRAYRDTCGDARMRAQVEVLLTALGRPRPSSQSAMRDSFVRFTNDLDLSRGQSLAHVDPRLWRALVANGFVFSGKHLYAGDTILARLVRRWPDLAQVVRRWPGFVPLARAAGRRVRRLLTARRARLS